MNGRLLVAATLALGACGLTTMFEPKLDPLNAEPLLFPVSDLWSVPSDASYPTDLALLSDGGFAIVDGYNHRALVYGADRRFVREVGIDPAHGTPVRAARGAAEGQWWLTVPDAGALLEVGADGVVQRTVHVTHADGSAARGVTTVFPAGSELVVGLEDGRLAWVDAATGVIARTLDADVDGAAFGMIVDLAAGPEGTLLVTDAFGAKVHQVSLADGAPQAWVGHFGMWIGYLMKPKSAAPGPDGTVVVADSELGVLQVFDGGGKALGVLADGEILRFGHPIAVKSLGEGRFLSLDSRTGMVWGFTLADSALAAARDEAATWRFLRTRLIDADQDEQLADGSMCYQCHDGTILDDRAVWDPDLGHHPIDVVPDGDVPDFFPLSESGRIVCTTCHSPHGVVEIDEAASVDEGAEVNGLVRHAPQQEGDLFTRLSRSDSQLCIACHTDAAHDQVLEAVGLTGTSHPTGKSLADALAKRGDRGGVAGLPAGVDSNCLTCHAVHGAAANGLRRDATSGEVCMSCHQDKAVTARNHPLGEEVGKDLRVMRANLPTSASGTQTCQTCHALIGGRTDALLQTPERGTLCTTCHDPGKLTGPHASVKGKAGLACLGCHDVHDAPAGTHLLKTLASATSADPHGCGSCHGPGGAQYTAAVQPGVHGHLVGSDDLTCASCHDAHIPSDPPACTSCHDDQKAALARGGHGKAVCVSCHPAHAPTPVLPASLVPPGEKLNPRSLACLACHAPGTTQDAPKVAAYDHPIPVFTLDGQRWTPLGGLPLYSEAGKLLPTGQNGALVCSTCHETHGPSAVKPGDNLRRPGWEEACGSCHGPDALVLYRFFHNPRARASGGGGR